MSAEACDTAVLYVLYGGGYIQRLNQGEQVLGHVTKKQPSLIGARRSGMKRVARFSVFGPQPRQLLEGCVAAKSYYA